MKYNTMHEFSEKELDIQLYYAHAYPIFFNNKTNEIYQTKDNQEHKFMSNEWEKLSLDESSKIVNCLYWFYCKQEREIP